VNSPKTVIVTGAGSGIGAGVAAAFATEGARVYVADLSPERAEATVATIGAGAVACTLDVSDFGSFHAMVTRVVEETGRVDVLVNSAGVFDGVAGILETSPELWVRVIGINLTGTFNGSRAVAEHMVRQKSGRIVNISSIAASRAMPDGAAYDASKAGIEGLTRRLAVDLGPYGVTANALAVGVIRTSIRATSEEILGDLVDVNRGVGTNPELMNLLIPAQRGGTVEEVAATVLFLASDGAAYINGDVIRVDGGWHAS
jgi:3-oxoacyl-[acyl-carrier protein] reductase